MVMGQIHLKLIEVPDGNSDKGLSNKTVAIKKNDSTKHYNRGSTKQINAALHLYMWR